VEVFIHEALPEFPFDPYCEAGCCLEKQPVEETPSRLVSPHCPHALDVLDTEKSHDVLESL